MTTPRTLASYGAPYVDAIPVDDPTTTESSTYHNRLSEDSAQMTCVTMRARVTFTTITGSAGPVTPTAGQSVMGVGSAALPTIAKTATGLYTITYPASWTDGVGQAEDIAFQDAWGQVNSRTTVGRVQVVPNGNLLEVLVLSNIAGTDTPSDLTGVSITIWAD